MNKIDLDDLEQRARASLAGLRAGVDCTVAIALIARIRELEGGLGRVAVRGKPQSTWIRALLDKGAVLP